MRYRQAPDTGKLLPIDEWYEKYGEVRMGEAPMVIGPMEPYRSPVDGTMITDRKYHREHIRKHKLIEIGNEKLTRSARKEHNPTDIKQDIVSALKRA